MVTKYCCCCENLKAAKILGIIGLVIYSICLIWSVFATWSIYSTDYSQITSQLQNLQTQLGDSNNDFLNEVLKQNSEQFNSIQPAIEKARINVILSVVYSLLGLIANACLVHGAIKSKKNFILVWVVMAIVIIILQLVNIGIDVSLGGANWISALIGLGFFVWQFLAVFGAYRELKEGSNAQI